MDTRINKGSRFWFTLTVEKSLSPKIFSPQFTDSLKNIRILVVQPKPTTIRVLTAYFSEWGCTHVMIQDPDLMGETLTLAMEEKRPFDLVLVEADPQIQRDMGKFFLTNHDLILNGIPLALITPDLVKENRLKPVNGMDTWISKPLKKRKLFNCLAGLLGKAPETDSFDDQRGLVIHQAPGNSDIHKKQLSILLVEDNIVNQKIVLTMLSSEYHEVTTALDGIQALAEFEAHAFDLILMDIQMPVMGGLDAAQKIRALEKATNNRIPIVALTANAMKGDRETCMAAGMDNYLPKPIKKDQLISMIKRITGQ